MNADAPRALQDLATAIAIALIAPLTSVALGFAVAVEVLR